MLLTALAAAALSFLFASVFTSVDHAAQMSQYVLVMQTLLSGSFVRLEQVPQVLRWLQWLSPLKYGLSIMFIAEFQNQPNGTAFLSQNQVSADMILFYIFMLLGLVLIYRSLAILALWSRSRKSTV